MNIKQAIERLRYTFEKGHKINETDKLALNVIIKNQNAQLQTVLSDHLLFAKLYAVILRDFALYYKDIDFANKQINRELEAPIEWHLGQLKQAFDHVELKNYFKSKGITDTSLTTDNIAIYGHLFPEINVKDMPFWDAETLKYNFECSVNQSILCFKNSK